MIRSALVTAFLCAASLSAAQAEPWDIPTDPAVAIRNPDLFAWQMFVAVTWPADVEKRTAATDKPLGTPGPMVFETWPLTDQVYLPKGAKPVSWDEIPWKEPRQATSRAVPRQVALFREVEPVPPGDGDNEQEEIRYNRPTFDYVRDNGLYSIEGQQRFFYDRRPVDFPVDSVVIKVTWRVIDEADKPRYQWETFTDPKTGKSFTYGLTAMHLTSKVLPNWHWATFEHIDNRFRHGTFDEGWMNPSRDAAACPPDNLDCNRIPTGFGLEGTHWENYRLRGSMVSYTDAIGNPVILANSELETGMQQTSSCMSCHTRSTIGPSQNVASAFATGAAPKGTKPGAHAMRLQVGKQLPSGQFVSYNGAPDPGEFLLPGQASGGTETYLRLDFLWSLFEANSEAGP